jgi:DNA-directed RNA polymerase specialized sigma24 family protein
MVLDDTTDRGLTIVNSYTHPLIEESARLAARRYGRRLSDPDDFLQSVRVRAWRLATKRPGLTPDDCYRLAPQVAAFAWGDFARPPRSVRGGRQRPKVVSLDALRDARDPFDPEARPEHATPDLAERDRFEHMIRGIGSDLREMLRLRHVQDFTHAEIGRRFRICESLALRRIKQAHAVLARTLTDHRQPAEVHA